MPADSETIAGARTGGLRAALRERDFAVYWVGSLLSNCGTWFQNIAQTLLVYRLTGSVFLIGVVNVAQFAGVFIVGPVAGVAADRFDRRRLLLTTQSAACTVTAVLALVAALGHATVPLVIAVALVLGLLQAVGVPSMLALVPSLVAPTNHNAAVALNIVTFNAARAVGPVLGAIVVDSAGVPTAFAVNALSSLAFVVALMVISPRPARSTQVASGRPRLIDTLRLVAGSPQIAPVFLVAAAASFAVDPITTLSPAYSTEIFGAADTLVGWFVGVFGAGAVAAALWVAGRPAVTDRALGCRALLLAGGMTTFALSNALWLAMVAACVAGFGFIALSTSGLTRVQGTTDPSDHGRIMALWAIAFMGSRPVAALIDGALAEPLGLRAATLIVLVPLVVFGARLAVRGRRTQLGELDARPAASAE